MPLAALAFRKTPRGWHLRRRLAPALPRWQGPSWHAPSPPRRNTAASITLRGRPRAAISRAYPSTLRRVTPLWSRAHVHQMGRCRSARGGARPGRGSGASARTAASLALRDSETHARISAPPSTAPPAGATRPHGCTTPSSSQLRRACRRSMRSPAARRSTLRTLRAFRPPTRCASRPSASAPGSAHSTLRRTDARRAGPAPAR